MCNYIYVVRHIGTRNCSPQIMFHGIKIIHHSGYSNHIKLWISYIQNKYI